MLEAIVIFLVIVLIGVVLYKESYSVRHQISKISSFDGFTYNVHMKHPNQQEAAELMAKINHGIVKFMRYLKMKYITHTIINNTIPITETRTDMVKNMLARYNPDRLAESSPLNPLGETSFTINKGKTLALCLRDPKTLKFHDFNLLFFVTIHEMAHIAIERIDHSYPFWNAFKFLLAEAAASDIYISTNYAVDPVYYCGMDKPVNYNPLYDNSLQIF